ncbi:GMC family oxidoreductase N-terminal domain-containing protein [Rhodobacter sp. 24-YEA-8]|uniref:GMC family oxidoreductase N-terminal domain-containing protein n=1 Tax=Rhodobacter sp. 24-YEA-8 TaxID=1884310 RepID=UPI000B840FFE
MVLSSGTIGSPWLLWLSGIGPAGHLLRHGSQVLPDQPVVGADLQDHPALFVIAECSGPHIYDRGAEPLWSALAGPQFILTQRGPVASSFYKTGGARPMFRSIWASARGSRDGLRTCPIAASRRIRPSCACGSARLASADPLNAPLRGPYFRRPL